jgi:hypothetical protein
MSSLNLCIAFIANLKDPNRESACKERRRIDGFLF